MRKKDTARREVEEEEEEEEEGAKGKKRIAGAEEIGECRARGIEWAKR